MKMADMHIHSTFSPDGVSSMEEQCRQAVKQGVSIICFTDHVDFNAVELNMGRIKDNRKQNFKVDEYLSEIERMRFLFPELEILSGVEFSEPHLFRDEFEQYTKLPLDYILASIHHCKNGVFPGAINLSESQAVLEYYDFMLESLERCEFQGIAHMDFPRLFFDNWNIDEKILCRILQLIISKNIALEINTSSMNENCYDPMPSVRILKKYMDMGGTRIVLGSDAHNSKRIAYGFNSIISKWPKGLDIGYIKGREFYSL